MVRMQVCQQHVHISTAQPQLSQPREEGLPAGRLAEPRVDEQITVLPPNQIGVELLERISRQGNGNPMDILHDFLRHEAPPN